MEWDTLCIDIDRHPLLRANLFFVFQALWGALEKLWVGPEGSSLISRIGHRDTTGKGGDAMAPIILSARLCGELEDLVLGPLRPRSGVAQAVLWLAEGLSAEQVAETFQVSRQTVYNWVNRFLRRDDLELRARLLDAPRPGRPLRSPRSSTPGLRRPSLAIPASRVIMPRSGPPSCCSTTWSTLMGSRPRQEHQRGDRTPGSPLETAPA